MGEINSVFICTLWLNCKTYAVTKILRYIKSIKIVKLFQKYTKYIKYTIDYIIMYYIVI